MKVLLRYTIDTIRRNRHTSLSIMAAILLSSTLLYALCSYAYNQLMLGIEVTEYEGGTWHGELGGDLTKKDLELVDQNLHVEKTMIKGPFRALKLPDEVSLPYLLLTDADSAYWEEMGEKNSVLEGRAPRKPGEIVVSKTFFERNPQFKLGDTVRLPRGQRILGGEELGVGIRMEGESFLAAGEEAVTLVGKLDVTTPTTVPGYYSMGYMDRANISPEDKLVVYLKMKNIRDTYRIMPEIAETLGIEKDEYGRYVNKFRYHTRLLLYYNVFDPQEPFNPLNYSNVLIFILLALLSAAAFILIIQSAFSLSAKSQARQIGIFRSVGATPGQIRTTLLLQGAILAAVPLLLSVGLGHLFTFFTFKLYSHIAGDSLYFPITVRFSWSVAAGAVLLSLATVLLSALLPARRIAGLSPLEVIREPEKSRKIKKSKGFRFFHKATGICGELASVSYRSNRRAFRASIASMTICMVLVLSFFSLLLISDLVSERNRQANYYNINARLQMTEKMNPDLWEEIDAVPGIQEKTYYSVRKVAYQVSPDQELDDFSESGGLAALDPEMSGVVKRDGNYRILVELVGLEPEFFDAYCRENGADPAKFYETGQPGALAMSWAPANPSTNNAIKAREFLPFLKLAEGQQLVLEEKTEDTMDTEYTFSVDIGAVVTKPPQIDYLPRGYRVMLCVPMEVYDSVVRHFQPEYASASYRTYLLLKTTEANDLAVTKMVREICEKNLSEEDVKISSMAEDRQNNEVGGRAMGAVMNCIGVLLGLIGAANALSSVSGSMRQRRKEFAMLRSVGMDSGMVKKMLILEGIKMATTPLLLAVPIIVALWTFMLNTTEISWISFLWLLPYGKMAGYVGIITAVLGGAYWISSRRILRDTIIDALRDETI